VSKNSTCFKLMSSSPGIQIVLTSLPRCRKV
jgi:hypothetical protein